MAYTKIDITIPTAGGTRATDIPGINTNLRALVDAVNMGMVVDWNFSISGTTGGYSEYNPNYYLWTYATDSNYILRATCTWSSGIIQTMLWELSTDGGSDYTSNEIGTQTFTYGTTGACTAVDWS